MKWILCRLLGVSAILLFFLLGALFSGVSPAEIVVLSRRFTQMLGYVWGMLRSILMTLATSKSEDLVNMAGNVLRQIFRMILG